MTRSSRRKRYRLALWILLNWLGIGLGSFATLFLYSSQALVSHGENGLRLFLGLALCGAIQGVCFGSIQTMAALATHLIPLKQLRWLLLATIASMTFGLALPLDVMQGWQLSWLLAGLLYGAIVGSTPKQKLVLGLLNAGAYSCWGVASFLAWMGIVAALDYPPGVPLLDLVLGFLFVVMPTLICGSGLNSLVLRALSQQ
jgi:hypothetical protein